MTRTLAVLMLAAAFALSAPQALGQLFIVPSVAYPTIQDAIDAAPEGAEITVFGGTYDPISINKALTITGTATIVADSVLGPQGQQLIPPISLSGNGGTVVLEGLTVTGTTNGQIFGQNVPGIGGGGFDELVLLGCDVEAPSWFSLTGLGVGQPGIDVGVPLVRLEDSVVTGGFTDIDSCDVTQLADGAAGIVAPGVVSVKNSTVTGGAGPIICLSFGCGGSRLGGGVCNPLTFQGGGGPGIVCDTALIDFTASVVEGGAGAEVICFEGKGEFVCFMPDGEPIIATTTLSLGGQLVVPGTHATIAAALAVALPDDVILVLGGNHGPFVVTQSVTLQANPPATITNVPSDPAVLLLGPGSGRVTLSGFTITGSAGGQTPTVVASGFDDVAFIDCDITGLDLSLVGEDVDGGPAISIDGGHLLLSRTTVTGGAGLTVQNLGPINVVAAAGGLAVDAAGNTSVTLLDSTLTGGAGGDADVDFPCPPCENIVGGFGGAGLRANGATFISNSIISGGAGASLTCIGATADGVGGPYCTLATGVGVLGETTITNLGFDLVGNGPLVVGSTWTLGWQATAPSVLLIISPLPSLPTMLPGAGVLYADLDLASITPLPGAGTYFIDGMIPDDPVLLGVLATFQIYDPLEGFSRPLIELFAP